jgi:hypothetical protein
MLSLDNLLKLTPGRILAYSNNHQAGVVQHRR